jgi:hypothetical protein
MPGKNTFRKWQKLWTVELTEHVLVQVMNDDGEFIGYMPVNLRSGAWYRFDDVALEDTIIENMLQAGVRVVSSAEFDQIVRDAQQQTK